MACLAREPEKPSSRAVRGGLLAPHILGRALPDLLSRLDRACNPSRRSEATQAKGGSPETDSREVGAAAAADCQAS